VAPRFPEQWLSTNRNRGSAALEYSKIYRQRLELEKKRVGWTDKDDNGQQYGIAEIPAIDYSLLDTAIEDPNMIAP
jgi:hypothetical protein